MTPAIVANFSGYTMHMKNKRYSYIQPDSDNNTSYDFSVNLIPYIS